MTRSNSLHHRILGALFLCAAAAGSARAALTFDQVTVLGADVPSEPVIPGLPGYSGYEVHIRANDPALSVYAVDVGTNPADYPQVSSNFGLFGPMHQHWFKNHDETFPTPYQSSDLTDSTFLFTYDAYVMAPRENITNSLGLTSPLPDDQFDQYGVGDTMRSIVGVSQMRVHELPFAYLVIPNGSVVHFEGQIALGANMPPRAMPQNNTVVSFNIGSVPEPQATLAILGLANFAGLRLLRRRTL